MTKRFILEIEGSSLCRSGSEEDGALPADHFRVYIRHAPFPSLADLRGEFGKHNVSTLLDGRPFRLHPSCVGMSRMPGYRIFYLQGVGRDWECEERIAWGLQHRSAVAPFGYRPATRDEGYEFHKAHPGLLDYVTLGSFASLNDERWFAGLWGYKGQRIFGGDSVVGPEWGPSERVLFVVRRHSELLGP